MINARATDKVLTKIQEWARTVAPSQSELARSNALHQLFDSLRGLGDGNSSYEETIVNLAKLLELRMLPDQKKAAIVHPGAAVKAKPEDREERVQCGAKQSIWMETGENRQLQCGRGAGHNGKHTVGLSWEDAADAAGEVAA